MSGFRFKQFAIEQDDVAMKVGTDGVLLGAWANCEGAKRILDIGTGTGVIALQMAQRNNDAEIYAVEIDDVASKRARSNFDMSPWTERLHVECCAIQDYEAEQFNLIISNPPYFVDSLLPPDERRSMARHTHDLTFEELDKAVCRLLADNGRFALILPKNECDTYLAQTKLNMQRRCDVYSVEGGAVKRVIVELSKCAVERVKYENIAIEVERRGEFSDAYRTLTKDFYLKF